MNRFKRFAKNKNSCSGIIGEIVSEEYFKSETTIEQIWRHIDLLTPEAAADYTRMDPDDPLMAKTTWRDVTH